MTSNKATLANLFALSEKEQLALAGMVWQPLEEGVSIRRALDDLVKQEGAGIYLIDHVNDTKVVGFSSVELTPAKGYYSLALLSRKLWGTTWIGLFETTNSNYWLVGFQGGLVVPGMDVLFHQLSEAVDRFNEFLQLFKWEKIYVSPNLGLQGEEIEFKAFLKQLTLDKEAKLNQVFDIKKVVKRIMPYLLFGILVVLCLAVGYMAYDRYQLRLQREAMLRLQQTKVVEPWRKKPPALAFMISCVQTISEFPLEIGGWEAKGFMCEGSAVKAVYQRSEYGSVLTFSKAADEKYPKKYHFQNKGEAAQIDVPIQVSGTRATEQPQPIKELVKQFMEKIQVGEAKGTVEDILNSGKKTATFDLNSEQLPQSLLRDIDVQGVVVDKLLTTVGKNGQINWRITGVIYGS